VKILVITNLFPPEFIGGYELGCAQMVGELRSRGHEVRVVTSVSAEAQGGEASIDRVLELPPIYNPDRMQMSSPELNRYFNVLSAAVNPANLRALGRIVDEFAPDVCYLWNILGLGGLGILALLKHHGVGWVWHIMDTIPRQMSGFATAGPELARELNNVFPGRYISCSSHVLGEIRVGEVDLGDHVHVIPNWLHGPRSPTRTSFFAGGRLRVLSASGTLCEPKGTHILIEAAALLRERGFANFTIDLYGRIEDARFRRMVLEHGVEELVNLKGSRPHADLIQLYRTYDVFAFPTWSREPSAFAPLEAAGAGCVPVITDTCGNAEWMIHGVDCLKARRDPVHFADRIEQILDRQWDLAALGTRAQSVAWREFHITTAADSVERVLGETQDDRRPSRGSATEFFNLARFAEGLIQTLIVES
jgi:glycosyltransferase involved in cell wall biosynthesis